MGENLILGRKFDLEKIEFPEHRHLVSRLLTVTENLTRSNTIYLHQEDFDFAEKIDKKKNLVGENSLALLSQVIDAVKIAFSDEKIFEEQKISLTMSDGKCLNFHAAKG